MDIAVIDSLKGDARKTYGDYAFTGVVDICEELREDDPFLFNGKGPIDIAEEVMAAFESQSQRCDMIKELFLYEAGILTFRLEGCWLAERINQMFTAGMDTWAPQFFPGERVSTRTRAVFIFPANMMTADWIRSICIKDVLANIFLYSGMDVGSGAFDKLALDMVRERFAEKRGEIVGRCLSPEASYFHVKGPSTDFYTDVAKIWTGMVHKLVGLKRGRQTECTIKFEDLLVDVEGNTFGSILQTRLSVHSIMLTFSCGSHPKLNALSAGIECELGLHLLEFTDAVERAGGTLRPDILCEYLCNLSKLFNRYRHESLHDSENMLGLCHATSLVMSKCFHVLVIDSDSNLRSDPIWIFAFRSSFSVKQPRPTGYHIIPPLYARNEHLNSRFEILSMNVEVAHSSFDRGSIYGDVSVLDTYLSRPDGEEVISNGTYVSPKDPSSLHSIPFESSIKVSVMVIATSEEKDQTYLLANCMGTPGTRDLNQFWSDKSNLMYGTINCDGRDGRVLLDYVAIKNAVDTKMKLTASTDLRVYGKILACYGDEVLGGRGFLGQYYALIFNAYPSECIRINKGEPVPLLRSTLAVPADRKLKIEAHLTDADTGEVIDSTWEFLPILDNFSIWDIQFDGGSFEFTVNWVHQSPSCSSQIDNFWEACENVTSDSVAMPSILNA
ncbi:arginine--tRNA ligase, cytoplasmic [Artemisia annua]|uniref:arginine--tRNA ligase n=1 Tax=Artemisia annua TaxID=35608 RepID=A0A2U1PTK1_ARTAN|nr:arginine--tRNA ligase, cytoplasmic [Artemisia annua]